MIFIIIVLLLITHSIAGYIGYRFGIIDWQIEREAKRIDYEED